MPVRARPGPQPAPVAAIAWSKCAVRAILTNPRYTGYQVWNRQRSDEVLLDVDDVALGHADQDAVEPSRPVAVLRADRPPADHQPGRVRAGPGDLGWPGQPHSSQAAPPAPVYALRGVLHCGLCGPQA